MHTSNKNLTQCISALLAYERGQINLKQVTVQLTNLSGLSRDTAENFIKRLKRSNVIYLENKK